MNVYDKIYQSIGQKRKLLAVLVDPDKCTTQLLNIICDKRNKEILDFIFVGGSLVSKNINDTIIELKKRTEKPIVLFPGNSNQLSDKADALLMLSLISGRNPEYLIGQHVNAAPIIARSKIEVIPTGYILIDGGVSTSVEYMSNTRPIPRDKIDIAIATSLAGQYLGLKMLYLEAGSGAQNPVPIEMIKAVKENVNIPIIVGGGLRTKESIEKAYQAGADIVVVGTAIENNPDLLTMLK